MDIVAQSHCHNYDVCSYLATGGLRNMCFGSRLMDDTFFINNITVQTASKVVFCTIASVRENEKCRAYIFCFNDRKKRQLC